MSRLRHLVAASAALALASAAVAADSPPGLGTPVSSGTKIVAGVSSATDSDDYIFEGYTGQKVSVAVTAAKGSTLLPLVEFFRPDGSLVTSEDGAKFTPAPGKVPGKVGKVLFNLDQTGFWTVRVRGGYAAILHKGDNPNTPTIRDPDTNKVIGGVEKSWLEYDYDAGRTSGGYSISVKYPAPRPPATKNAVPDAFGEYRFVLSASGGATLNAKLSFKGGTPTFKSLTDPSGVDVSGIVPVVKSGKSVELKNVQIPAGAPLGGYQLRFQSGATPSTKVNLTASIKLPPAAKALKATFTGNEPSITQINPARGGPDIQVVLNVNSVIDDSNPDTSKIRVYLDRLVMDPTKMTITPTGKNAQIRFTTPDATVLRNGTYDVKVTSTAGQAAVLRQAFSVVPAPKAFTIDPVVGSASGGFSVTITGSGFNTRTNGMRVRFRDVTGSATITPPITFSKPITDTELVFNMPSLTTGEYAVSVVDDDTQRASLELTQTLELASTAAINRVTPGLVTILGQETVFVNGANFKPTDKIFVETVPNSGTPGSFELMASTYISEKLHSFEAPVRSKGIYRVKLEDATGYTAPMRTFAYYSFADLSGGFAGVTDGLDAWTTALADFDNDGDPDLFLSRKGGETKATTSQTRVVVNDGAGNFTDVTATSMPAPTSDDDWRADRIWVTDVTQDGYADIVITTRDESFPPKNSKSHTRILVNERLSTSQPVTNRIFRDRTADLMPPLRTMSNLYGSYLTETDDWSGLDMWVGDLDLNTQSPPEIVITTDKVFENYYVSCTPYCASPYSGGYTYSFYWGGTRVFKWDKSARSGLGRYKYDANFFPRKSGITVAIFNPPPGVIIPVCKSNCRGVFTPFVGQRLAVGSIDFDGKPDFAVLNKGQVMRDGGRTSSLQVALNRIGFDGSNVTDLTTVLAEVGSSDYLAGDAVAIGQPGYPDGAYGVVAVGKADVPSNFGSSALRLIRWKPPAVLNKDNLGSFVDDTAKELPLPDASDWFQSSQIAFVDVDEDGDQDLVTLSSTLPGGGGSAFRVFRNEVVGADSGVFTRSLEGLLAPLAVGAQKYDGQALAIGDVNSDEVLDFVMTRSDTTIGTGKHTRAIKIDR